MNYTHYVQDAIDLVNADLSTAEQLAAHLEHRPWLSAQVAATDLAPLRVVQAQLATLVDASAAGEGAAMVALLNDLLARNPVRPRGDLIKGRTSGLSGGI